MKTILQETTAEVVGLSTRKHQDWFDEAHKETQELLEKKRSCHNRLLAQDYAEWLVDNACRDDGDMSAF